jgi:macrolide transport system ATP-binding/permease protein
VFLADEPTGQLDSRSGQEIISILASLHAEQGITVLVVSHDANVAHQCQRVIHLKDGEIVAEEKV